MCRASTKGIFAIAAEAAFLAFDLLLHLRELHCDFNGHLSCS